MLGEELRGETIRHRVPTGGRSPAKRAAVTTLCGDAGGTEMRSPVIYSSEPRLETKPSRHGRRVQMATVTWRLIRAPCRGGTTVFLALSGQRSFQDAPVPAAGAAPRNGVRSQCPVRESRGLAAPSTPAESGPPSWKPRSGTAESASLPSPGEGASWHGHHALAPGAGACSQEGGNISAARQVPRVPPCPGCSTRRGFSDQHFGHPTISVDVP